MPNQFKQLWVWFSRPVRRGWLVAALLGLSVAVSGLILALIAWHLRIRPAETVWGNVAEWATAIGAAVGFVFIGLQALLARIEQRERRARETATEESERRSRAGAIGVNATIGGHQRPALICETINAGFFPVFGAMATPVEITSARDEIIMLGTAKKMGKSGVLFPSSDTSSEELQLPQHVDTSALHIGVLLEFSDSWGSRWRRVVDIEGRDIRFDKADHVPIRGYIR